MRIHYFQRYNQEENVATANTILLLFRFYHYSPEKFYIFLNELIGDRYAIDMRLQVRNNIGSSVADAVISQKSFKIVVETKIEDWFYSDQLMNHLDSFGDETGKFLLTLCNEPMDGRKKKDFEERLEKYNNTQNYKVTHINTTFLKLAEKIRDCINDTDSEMIDIIEDYLDYCSTSGLISNKQKTLKVRSAGITLEFNVQNGIYYDPASRGSRTYDYFGLYSNKTIGYIGKVAAEIIAVEDKDHILQFNPTIGEVTEERKQIIKNAIKDAEKYGWTDLRYIEHKYVFVDRFYETDFRKVSKGSMRGTRYFDLESVLNEKQLPETKKIASLLKGLTWE